MSLASVDVSGFIARGMGAQARLAALSAALTNLKAAAEVEEVKKLQIENEDLKKQVEIAKKALSDAELKNGKAQYPLPGAKTIAATALTPSTPIAAPIQTTTASTPASAPASAPAPENDGKKEEGKKEKPKKEAKVVAPPKPVEPEKPVDISCVDFRVGLIVKAEKHPTADKLYIEDVDTGEATHRTVVSGLFGKVPLDQMQNRLVVLWMNLKPSKLQNVMSQAMVMCAGNDEKTEVLDPPAGSVPGDIIEFEGYPRNPDAEINPKKGVTVETILAELKTNEDRVATYKGVPFTIKGKGVVTSATLTNSKIK